MELQDYPEDLGKYHSSEFPILLRYMTDREIERKPDGAGFARNFPRRGPRIIALLRKESKLQEGSTLVHELGHVRNPVLKPDEYPERLVYKSFSELLANYYQLGSKVPNKPWVREKIRRVREDLWDMGLSKSQIDKLEGVAKQRVGYKGKRVSWERC